jgi:ABC-type cobalamin/Fe3+-siderophores transport system ATPase subunit
VSAGYGDSVVIEDIARAIGEGECVALLGRNGVGKTTLLTTVMGLTRLHRGTVRWRGADISRTPTTSARAPASAGCRRSAHVDVAHRGRASRVGGAPGTVDPRARCTRSSRASPSAAITAAASSRAASSRCWRSRARW